MYKPLSLFLALLCTSSPALAVDYNPGHLTSDGYYKVLSANDLESAVKSNLSMDGTKSYAKIRLMNDIYLSDRGTGAYLDRFCGILDGDGHTIYGGHDNQLDGGNHYCVSYLFSTAVDATFMNLTFRNIRIQSDDSSYQGVIASQMKNTTLQNITMHNISVYCNKSYAATITGYSIGCTFQDVQVLHSDVTVMSQQAGGIVANAEQCIFRRCQTDDQTSVFSDGPQISPNVAYAGGLVGNASTVSFYDCINRAIVGGDFWYIGGIAGHNAQSGTINGQQVVTTGCVNSGIIVSMDEDDFGPVSEKYRRRGFPNAPVSYCGQTYYVQRLDLQASGWVDNDKMVGGIYGGCASANITQCCNLGSVHANGDNVGGIVGFATDGGAIVNCLHTGLVVSKETETCGSIMGSSSSGGNSVGFRSCFSTQALRMVGEDSFTDPLSIYNYRLQGGPSCKWEVQVSSEMIQNGLVAYWLNNSSDNRQRAVKPWYQNIASKLSPGTDDDEYPVLDATHHEVTPDQIIDHNYVTISNPAQLLAFARQVNEEGNLFACAALAADIDMTEFHWVPIGNDSHRFRGIFDGRGHTITGLAVDVTSGQDNPGDGGSNYHGAGLFGTVDINASILNVIVGAGSTVRNKYDAGAAGIVGTVHSGGYFGYVDIQNCGSYAQVTTNKHGGGILGRIVIAENGEYMDVLINDCYTMADVCVSAGNSGLLCGYTRNHAIVSNCYSGGQLRSSTDVQPYERPSEYFVGYNTNLPISNCYAVKPPLLSESDQQKGVTAISASDYRDKIVSIILGILQQQDFPIADVNADSQVDASDLMQYLSRTN